MTIDEQVVRELISQGDNPEVGTICDIEISILFPYQKAIVLPVLEKYIYSKCLTQKLDERVAVGSAIRKYMACMPKDKLGNMSLLLDKGLPIELELEVAKMVLRACTVHPPVLNDPFPDLAKHLFEIVKKYILPEGKILEPKCSATASLAVEALVSLRSSLAEDAWRMARSSENWFSEMVTDDIKELYKYWYTIDFDSTLWLYDMAKKVCNGNPIL